MVNNTLAELAVEECQALLRGHHLGRLAFLDRAGVMPMIPPANYLFDDERVVFRTDPGSTLTAALHDAPVAFEVTVSTRSSSWGEASWSEGSSRR